MEDLMDLLAAKLTTLTMFGDSPESIRKYYGLPEEETPEETKRIDEFMSLLKQ